jgi:type II secretory ATPase GspE/PulE/Tfp pilus assembly ATPase PilB-like protein
LKQKIVNIKNVYDDKELSSIDSDLKFDKSWDQQVDFTTKQVLAVPIIFRKFLLGAIQLINRKDNDSFTKLDEQSATEMAKILGIALYNQKRRAKAMPGKFDYFLENHILTQQELEKAVVDARVRRVHIEAVLMSDYKIPKQDIGKALSQYYKVPFVEYNANIPTPQELIAGLKVPFMLKNIWVPLRKEGRKIIIVIDNPYDLQKIGLIKPLFPDKQLVFNVALEEDVIKFIKLFGRVEREQQSREDLIEFVNGEEDIEEEDPFFMQTAIEDSKVVQYVQQMIMDAYQQRSSDIHIEPYPGKQNTQIRIRVDGACTDFDSIPYDFSRKIVSRIKILAGLDIAERRKPQDGKIKFNYGGLETELRIATVPSQGGVEDVVMRILAAGEPLPLEKMGFSEKNYDNFINAITKPYGIIFVCGPTGSGKTTTLHSALGYINKTERKIWTAEDPVEITQRGLRQVQVKPLIGFDFAAAMRAFLRADPDVIMVGEMRDKETTSIGIEASLTGHLVFSTLHTNSAPESISRLLDIGMDPFNFADAILCILAQRLVRTLCKKCKASYNPSNKEYDELIREYGSVEEFENNLNIPYSDELKLNKPAGCDNCNNVGYVGRMGLHELLVGTEEMQKVIQETSPVKAIKDQAAKDGMVSLRQDGIEKIFSGNCGFLD